MQNVTPSKLIGFFKPLTIILIAVGIVLVIFLGTSMYIVDQTEEAVVTRFGRYRQTTGPGLQFKLPFGIDKQYVVNVKSVQTEQFGFRTLQSGIASTYANQTNESTMLTGDLNIVDVEWIIQYRVVDPVAWTFNVMERTATIRDVSRSAINMLVGDRTIMDIMGPERSAIEAAGTEFMNETFRSYGLGIDVIAVKLQNIDPPAGVQEAFDDVNKAEQDMNRLINEGQQAYNAEIPRAKGEAERLIQVSQGYATERVNRAKGDVARFNSVYEEYRKAPELTRQRLYYEMIEEVFKDDKETVIIDRTFNNFLPLKNLDTSRNSGAASQEVR
ncbi:MAG: FtsH protease activity modulator HflK [Spirochaetaceae bacterium]|jgi:membrane protease subunit HflK|nr:FtsH protease activity modulator HflK [Spirochaetaceae bacterium]